MAKPKNSGNPGGEPAGPEPIQHAGVAVRGTADPSTHINLEFGIDNLVAVGVVHAEARLGPRLEEEVAEVHRLGGEVTDRLKELNAIFTAEAVDAQLQKECDALVAAADRLGIRLTVELSKVGFSPDSLKYDVTVRFRGDLSTTRDYSLDNERADELQAEIAVLRERQAIQSRAVVRTKGQLSPQWLDKQLRASIARNAMNQTGSGSETLQALLNSIDQAIDSTAPIPRRQLTQD